MDKLKIALGADHGGFKVKEAVKEDLQNKGYEVEDFGTYTESSVDYPDFAHLVAKSVVSGESKYGIVVCGSGNGINMAVNKHKGIRSALCWNNEIAELARLHNDANVLALPGRYLTPAEAVQMADTFLNTPFEGGRHTERVNKIELC